MTMVSGTAQMSTTIEAYIEEQETSIVNADDLWFLEHLRTRTGTGYLKRVHLSNSSGLPMLTSTLLEHFV